MITRHFLEKENGNFCRRDFNKIKKINFSSQFSLK